MSKQLSRRGVIAGAAASAAALGVVGSVAAAPKTHEVSIKAFAFEPKHLQVKVGDIIKWTNHDLAPHTATETDFDWDTGELAKDQSAEITVKAGQKGEYFCIYHPHMKGSFEIL